MAPRCLLSRVMYFANEKLGCNSCFFSRIDQSLLYIRQIDIVSNQIFTIDNCIFTNAASFVKFVKIKSRKN